MMNAVPPNSLGSLLSGGKSGHVSSRHYKFGPVSSLFYDLLTPKPIEDQDSKCHEPADDRSGKYLKVCDGTKVFCYHESFQLENVFLPSPKYVSMEEMCPSGQSHQQCDMVKLSESVFNVLTLKGRQMVVCDDPGLLELAQKVQLRLTSSPNTTPDNKDTIAPILKKSCETFEIKIPAAAALTVASLMLPLEVNSDQEKVFRKNQFITMIKNELLKHGLRFWTDMCSFRPDPVIDGTKGKYHPFEKSKLDIFFMPKHCELKLRTTNLFTSPTYNQIGSGVLFCDTPCLNEATSSLTQSTANYNLLDKAMKEALIIGAEVATYALTHPSSSSLFTSWYMIVDVYLIIVSMKVDEAQILHMKLDLNKTGAECRPVYRLSYTETRCYTFNKLMNHLKKLGSSE